MNRMNWLACVVSIGGLALGAAAQDKAPEGQEGKAKPIAPGSVGKPQPMEMPYSQPAVWTDKDIEAVGKLLSGGWRTVNPVGQGDDKAKSADVFLEIAPVYVNNLPNAMYVEAARVDAPWAPFRQALWQIYKKQGEINIRTIEFRTPKGAQPFLVSMWAAPEVFPAGIDLSETYATMDIVVKLDKSGKGLTGKTPYPYPTSRQGAVEMTSEFTLNGDSLMTSDRGLDANGKVVWGSGEGKGYEFRRYTPEVQVQKLDSGVIRVNYGGGVGEEIAKGSRVGMHTVGSLMSGLVFENSRERNQLVAFRLGQDMPIAGFTEGTESIKKGERFKLIIPADKAFGPQGNPRFKVPGNAWLAYDIEVLTVEAAQPEPVMDPKAGTGPMAPTMEKQLPPAAPAKPN